jgi:ABC-type Na+ transport system ATPase subunit NatA
MEPTEGYVKREGNIAALLELASGFDGDLTVRENAYLRGAMLGYTRKFMDETYDQIIEFAELKDFQDRPFKQLSSGMKSRLAFAIASLVQPDILILDEVLSVGDGAFRKKSEAKMREIIAGGATTILVSHSIAQVQELCNKVLWLHKGEQIAFGDTAILCNLYQQFLDKNLTLEQAKTIWQQLNGHFDYLIVGSGLFGATFARQATDHGKKCLVIDRRPQLGENVFPEDADGTQEGGSDAMVNELLDGITAVAGISYQTMITAYPNIAEKIIYTDSIDEFFDCQLGRLEYGGEQDEELYQRYLALAAEEAPNVIFCGRLYPMDEAIAAALELAERELG